MQRRKRALKIGRTLSDGTATVSLVIMPEHLALLKELLQSRRRSTPMLRTAPGRWFTRAAGLNDADNDTSRQSALIAPPAQSASG